MSNNKKGNYKIRNFFVSIGLTITAALTALGIGSEVKKLNEPQPIMTEDDGERLDEIDNLYEISKTEVPIAFEALDKDNMGKYFTMYYNTFMKRYPEFSKLVNEEDPSINTELVSKYLLGFLKAYYADLSGKEFPFDENNLSLHDFNEKVTIKKYQNWFKRDGDGLYLKNKINDKINDKRIKKFEDKLLLAISDTYKKMEDEHQYDNAYLSRVIYNVFSKKIGLKDRPTSEQIYNAIEDELEEQKDENGFIDRIRVEGESIEGENNNYYDENTIDTTENDKDENNGR